MVAILSAIIAKFSAKWEEAQKRQEKTDEKASLDLLDNEMGELA